MHLEKLEKLDQKGIQFNFFRELYAKLSTALETKIFIDIFLGKGGCIFHQFPRITGRRATVSVLR